MTDIIVILYTVGDYVKKGKKWKIKKWGTQPKTGCYGL